MFNRRGKEKYDGAVPISDLFAKYRARLRPPQGVVVTAFCAAVEIETGHPLSASGVRYNVHTKTISISATGPHKSEIIFNKKRIFALCRETLGERGVPEHII